jgi:Fe-S cluster assembly protein SufD
MSSALNKPKYKMIIDNYYNQIANKEESFFEYGLLKGLYQHTKKAKSLTNLSKSCISQQKCSAYGAAKELVIVGENSHVQIIERHQS